jgi:hypothetical protein
VYQNIHVLSSETGPDMTMLEKYWASALETGKPFSMADRVS